MTVDKVRKPTERRYLFTPDDVEVANTRTEILECIVKGQVRRRGRRWRNRMRRYVGGNTDLELGVIGDSLLAEVIKYLLNARLPELP